MENKKSHKGLITTIIILAVLLLGAGGWIWYSCSNNESKIDLENYTPSEEFKPAFEAMSKPADPEYDIEETVRLLNGLEVAQNQSADFYSFLELAEDVRPTEAVRRVRQHLDAGTQCY